MADEVGRAALTIGGGLLFGPVGALAGGILGQFLFPGPDVKGPRLNEFNFQRSTVGAPIQIRYGTAKGAGNIIWSGGLIETEHEEEAGGKGGGPTVTNYTYSVDFAVGICEGPIDGIRRLWADSDLIYDSSDDATLTARFGDEVDDITEAILGIRVASAQLNFELYLGTEDQLPDPTIEAYEGVGNVPGFRGLAYILLPAFALARYGNRIPNIIAETFSGSPAECGIYSAGHLEPWLSGRDPRNPDNVHLYAGPNEGYGGGGYVADIDTALLGTGGLLLDEQIPSEDVHGWSITTTPNGAEPCNTNVTPNAPFDYVAIMLELNLISYSGAHYCDMPYDGVSHAGDTFLDVFGTGLIHWNGTYDPAFGFSGNGLWYGGDDCGPLTAPTDSLNTVLHDPQVVCGQRDQEIAVFRSLMPPSNWAITWTQVAGTFHVLQAYAATGTTPGHVVTAHPVGPAVVSTDPNYNDQDYWEAAYAEDQASANPELGPGLVYGVDYPEVQSFAFQSECTAVTVDCVSMATIVADICRRAGLRTDTSTQIDVSDLTTCVPGYVIGRQMSGRDALGPLRMYGLWDAVESGALLKFIERGHAIVETLTTDDLGVHENGSQAPSLVEVSRIQEKDLPRRVRLHFANFLHDHEVSEQSFSRITTEAVDELDVELAISMEPDTAAQLAEIMLYAQWVGRNTYRLSLDNSRLALEPTDCLEIPVDNQTQRVRIVAVDYSIGGIMRLDCVADDDGSYISTRVAAPSQPSGGAPGGPGSPLVCPTEAIYLDLPRLRDQDVDAGYYAAVYGLCDSWSCAEIYRSSDGGATYARVARTDRQATVGEIDDITGPPTDVAALGDSPQYDATSAITVSLFHGTLSSITDAQIDAGYNAAAIGQDGRWVIIQFKTATLDTGDTWILTDLIWGLRDTLNNLGTTVDGDTFVLLNDSALLRIPETPANIGVEKQLKVVTCGQSIDAADEISFTTWGLSYQRLCPSTVISASITDPPVSPTHGDSYLLPNDTSLSGVWELHGGEIATWSDETDSWVFCTPAPGTVVHIAGDSSTDSGEDVISGGDGTYTPSPWAPTSASYVTVEDERDSLPNSLPLIAGDNITFEQDSSGLIIHGAAGGGFDTSGDTSDIGIALDELTDVTIDTTLAEGDVLVYRGTEGWVNEPVETAVGGGGVLVGQATVVGSAATTLTVSGLDLDSDEEYDLTINLENATASVVEIRLFYNADTSPGNYSYGQLYSSGASAFGGTGTDAFVAILNSSADAIAYTTLPICLDLTGRPRCVVQTHGTPGTFSLVNRSHFWVTANTNVTSLTLSASVASSLAVGSFVKVYRRH